MYKILVDGRCVYACTDERRFEKEALKYASVGNARFEFPEASK